MGWTWDETRNTPDEVIDVLLDELEAAKVASEARD
jgi:hypothetical protein